MFLIIFIALLLSYLVISYSLQARPENFHYLTRIHYLDTGDGVWGEHEIDYILFLQKDLDLQPNPHEVSEIQYLKRNEIDRYVCM